MTAPRHLEVLQVEDVRQPCDIFACEAYNAKLSARACMARQDKHRNLADPRTARVGTGGRTRMMRRKGVTNDLNTRLTKRRDVVLARCASCEVGARVRKQVEG